MIVRMKQQLIVAFIALLMLLTTNVEAYSTLFNLDVVGLNPGASLDTQSFTSYAPNPNKDQKLAVDLSGQYYQNTVSLTIPAIANRVFIRWVFSTDDGQGGLNYVANIDTGATIVSGVWWEVPVSMMPGSNSLSFTSPELTQSFGSFSVIITRGGYYHQISTWSDYQYDQVSHVLPSSSYVIRIYPTAPPQNADRNYDIYITSGKLGVSNITFIQGSSDPAVIFYTPDLTHSQSDVVILTGVRNLTRAPAYSGAVQNDIDDWDLGDLPPFAVTILPNTHCATDNGHLILNDQYKLYVENSGDSRFGLGGKDMTACWWMRPQFSTQDAQVWLAVGPEGDDLQMGMYGADPTRTSNNGGIPFTPFMRLFNQTVELPSVSRYTPYDSANNNGLVTQDKWVHICHVFKQGINDLSGAGRTSMQMYLNGVPANEAIPVTNSFMWNPPSYPVTLGHTWSSTLPAYGAIDELAYFTESLSPLRILDGFLRTFWTIQANPNTQRLMQSTFIWTDVGQVYFDGESSWERSGGVPVFSHTDPVCTSMTPFVGTLNKLSGRDCIQPFETKQTTGIGMKETQDGQLRIGVGGSTTIGGATWIGMTEPGLGWLAPNAGDSSPTMLVCFWVKRMANYGAGQKQTIWSWGSKNHNGDGLASMSYVDDKLSVSFGPSRLDNTLISLASPSKDGSFSQTQDDVGIWVHWCMKYESSNPDRPAYPPYRHLLRNGQWFHTEYLLDGFQEEIKTIVQDSDNAFCLGCMLAGGNEYPLDGILDDMHLFRDEPYSSVADIYRYFFLDSWPYDSDAAAVAYLPFSEGTKGAAPGGSELTGRYSNSSNLLIPLLRNFTIFSGSSQYSFTNGTDITCLKLGSSIQDDAVQMGDASQSYVHRYAGLHQYGVGNTDYIATDKATSSALTLASHTYTFTNNDFSMCYWYRRAATNYSEYISDISYDVSIGTGLSASSLFYIGEFTSPVDGTTYYQVSFGTGDTPLTVPADIRGGNMELKKWIQICVTYQSKSQHGLSTGVRKLYRMGQLIGEDTPSTDLQSSAPITVGKRADGKFGQSGSHYYDELRIWSGRAITTDEIVSHLNTQSYTSSSLAPQMYFDFTTRSASGPTSPSKGEVLTCGGAGGCLYRSKTDGGQLAVQLNVPSLCPLGQYADGALMMTGATYNNATSQSNTLLSGLSYTESTPNELHLYQQSYSFSMWLRRSDLSRASTFVSIGCEAVNHMYSFSQILDNTSSIYSPTLFNALEINLTDFTVGQSRDSYSSVGDWTSLIIVFSSAYSAGQSSFVITHNLAQNYNPDLVQTLQRDAPFALLELDQCVEKGGKGFKVILGNDFSGTRSFSGYIDEFRLWSRALTDNQIRSVQSGYAAIPVWNNYAYTPQLKQWTNDQDWDVTSAMELYFNFQEQAGRKVYSMHDVTLPPTVNITQSYGKPSLTRYALPLNNLTELQWSGSGLSTFLQDGYESNSLPMMQTSMPLAEGAVVCRSSSVVGRPFVIYSSEVIKTAGLPQMNRSYTFELIWLQTLGKQGLNVQIMTSSLNVTINPSTIVYAPGEGGSALSVFSPKTFTVQSSIEQFFTLEFYLSGPEAVHFAQPIANNVARQPVASYSLTSYLDVTYISVVCNVLSDGVAIDQPDHFPFSAGVQPNYMQPDGYFTNGTIDGSLYNACYFVIRRYNNRKEMTPLFLETPAGSTFYSSPTQITGQMFPTPFFYVPIGDSYLSVRAPYQGTFTYLLTRTPPPQQIMNTTVPSNGTQNVPLPITLEIPKIANRANFTFNSTTPNVEFNPPEIMFVANWAGPSPQSYESNVSIPVKHPALSKIKVNVACTGYGCDQLILPAAGFVVDNTYWQTGTEIISTRFQYDSDPQNRNTTNTIGWNFTNNGPLMEVMAHQPTGSFSVLLELDQYISQVEWSYVLSTTPNIIEPSNFDNKVDVSAVPSVLTDTPSYTFTLASAGVLPQGSHMVYIRLTSGDGAHQKVFYHYLTLLSDLASTRFQCTSSIDAASSISHLTNPSGSFPVTLIPNQLIYSLTTDAYDNCTWYFSWSNAAFRNLNASVLNTGKSGNETVQLGMFVSKLGQQSSPVPFFLPYNSNSTSVQIQTWSGLYTFNLKSSSDQVSALAAKQTSLFQAKISPGQFATDDAVPVFQQGKYDYVSNVTFDINTSNRLALLLTPENRDASISYVLVPTSDGYIFNTSNQPTGSMYAGIANSQSFQDPHTLQSETSYQIWVRVSYMVSSKLSYTSTYMISFETNQNSVQQSWLTQLIFTSNTNPNNPDVGTKVFVNTQPYIYSYSVTLPQNTTTLSFLVTSLNNAASLQYIFLYNKSASPDNEILATQRKDMQQGSQVLMSGLTENTTDGLYIYSTYKTFPTTTYRINITIAAPVVTPPPPPTNASSCAALQCMYGGACDDSLPNLACQCATRFSATRCQLGVLYCLDNCLIPAAPSNTSARAVYANISLVVIGAEGLTSITVGDLVIPSSEFIVESLTASDSRVQLALDQPSKNWDESVKTLQTGFSLVTLQLDTAKVRNSPVAGESSSSSTGESSSSSSTGLSSSSSSTGSNNNTTDDDESSSSSSSSTALISSSSSSSSGSSSSSAAVSSSSSSSASSSSLSIIGTGTGTGTRRLLSHSALSFDTISTSGSSHLTLTFTSSFDGASSSISYTDLAYHSAYATCNSGGADEWKPDPNDGSKCLKCPEGGYCPGGGRVYPLEGYWSPDEWTAPVSCILSEKMCPGVTPTTIETTKNGAVNTRVCNDQYDGNVCTKCRDGYYQSGAQCLPCASHRSEQAQLAGLLILGIAVMGFLCIAVATATSRRLAFIVAMFVLLQQAIALGKDSSQSWPDKFKPLSDMLNALGIVNFDLTFMKPGCIGPHYSFIGTYYGTLLFAAIAWCMFVAACALRRQFRLLKIRAAYLLEKHDHYTRVNKELTDGDKTQMQVTKENETFEKYQLQEADRAKADTKIEFKRRLIHATMILGSLFYLKISTLNVNGLLCTTIPNPSADPDSQSVATIDVLRNDSSIECWTGAHIGTSVVIIFLLVFFTLGFPVICAITLTRAFAPILLRSPKFKSTFWRKVLLLMGYRAPTSIDADGNSTHVTTAPGTIVKLNSLHRMASLHRATSLDPDYLRERIEQELQSQAQQKGSPLTIEEIKEISDDTRVHEETISLHVVHMELFGYLFRGLLDDRYFFRLFAFPISFCFALVLIFCSQPLVRTFLLGLLYAFNGFLHTGLIPFILWRDNVLSSGIQLALLFYTIGVLSLQPSAGEAGAQSAYMLVLFFLAIAILVRYIISIVMKRKEMQTAQSGVRGRTDSAIDPNATAKSVNSDDIDEENMNSVMPSSSDKKGRSKDRSAIQLVTINEVGSGKGSVRPSKKKHRGHDDPLHSSGAIPLAHPRFSTLENESSPPATAAVADVPQVENNDIDEDDQRHIGLLSVSGAPGAAGISSPSGIASPPNERTDGERQLQAINTTSPSGVLVGEDVAVAASSSSSPPAAPSNAAVADSFSAPTSSLAVPPPASHERVSSAVEIHTYEEDAE